MSNDLNLCQFIGRLGKDPETRYMPNGDAVCNFSIACGWKSKDKEGAEWVRVATFGKLAEICGQYLKKGSQVYVAGRFQTRKWTDKDGVEKYSTEIMGDRMQMLGPKPQDTAAPIEKLDGKRAGERVEDIESDIPF